ncbi:hypothetical protein [Breznakiella homolactica]|uniref:DUF2746 domain-containing protein n=1 Tax=Breznakiella homolactica TaxID=2798577 RepID=A0A7T7XPY5_9SPIR|nr:hypothetical protein [Breznakiella homolactica]QQO10328.1 hypothetical protein JFL75_05250 [Breznakiella homolactica]
MEIAKFILTAVGTFLSVLGLSFTVFSYWRKRQDEKFNALKKTMANSVMAEEKMRTRELERLERRMIILEDKLMHEMQRRLSDIEGELKGLRPILQSIQNWFIENTPRK